MSIGTHCCAAGPLHSQPSPLKCILCSPCLDLFPSWPFAVLFLHSVLLESSIYNLSLPKFLSYFSPLQFSCVAFLSLSVWGGSLCLFRFSSMGSCICGYSDLQTTSWWFCFIFYSNFRVAALAFFFFFPTVSDFQITVAVICFKCFVYKWFPKIISPRLDLCLWPCSVQRPQQVPGSLWGWVLCTQTLKYSFCPAELVKCCSWTCRQLVMGERFCPIQNCPRWCQTAVVNLQLGLVKANWHSCLLFVFLFSLFCHGWMLVPLLSSALWPCCIFFFFFLYTWGLRAAALPGYVRSFKAHLLPSFQPSGPF